MRISDWSSDVCSSDLDRQEFEEVFAPFGRSEGIGGINFYSLASGFLTGKYRSAHDVQARRRKKSNQRYLTERGFRILDTLDAVSASLGVKTAQIALAWLVAQADVTAPRSEEHTSELQSLMRIPYAVFCLITKTSTSNEV